MPLASDLNSNLHSGAVMQKGRKCGPPHKSFCLHQGSMKEHGSLLILGREKTLTLTSSMTCLSRFLARWDALLCMQYPKSSMVSNLAKSQDDTLCTPIIIIEACPRKQNPPDAAGGDDTIQLVMVSYNSAMFSRNTVSSLNALPAPF